MKPDDVIKRLESLGYKVDTERDMFAINFLIDQVQDIVKNECQLDVIPDTLYKFAVDMVCAKFFMSQKANGDLGGFDVNLNETVLKQKSQGDTSVSFAVDKVKSTEERLDTVVEYFKKQFQSQLIKFRRLTW